MLLGKMRVRTGGSLEACGPARLVDIATKNRNERLPQTGIVRVDP